MSPPILSVSQFIELLNQSLGAAFPSVVVEGEVSAFSLRQAKYAFFDLKDEDTNINCFMMAYALKTPLEDGMKVRVRAYPKLTKWGRFSLNVQSLELAGEGDLLRALELLRQRLSAEGLFAQERKRPLPSYPARIGVITSAQGAAWHDFKEIINQRWNGVGIKLADVSVQGQSAPEQLIGAIEYFNQTTPLVEVLVIIRGGGSLEDLAAFNNEAVARTIASSRIPTLVGVGHEVDISLSDLVADRRAATPSDAARLIVPDREAMIDRLGALTGSIEQNLKAIINAHHIRLAETERSLHDFLQLPQLGLDNLTLQLGARLNQFSDQLRHRQSDLQQITRSLEANQQRLSAAAKRQLMALTRTLQNLNPSQVLARGYAIARASGRILSSTEGLKIGQTLKLELAHDGLEAKIKKIIKEV